MEPTHRCRQSQGHLCGCTCWEKNRYKALNPQHRPGICSSPECVEVGGSLSWATPPSHLETHLCKITPSERPSPTQTQDSTGCGASTAATSTRREALAPSFPHHRMKSFSGSPRQGREDRLDPPRGARWASLHRPPLSKLRGGCCTLLP